MFISSYQFIDTHDEYVMRAVLLPCSVGALGGVLNTLSCSQLCPNYLVVNILCIYTLSNRVHMHLMILYLFIVL